LLAWITSITAPTTVPSFVALFSLGFLAVFLTAGLFTAFLGFAAFFTDFDFAWSFSSFSRALTILSVFWVRDFSSLVIDLTSFSSVSLYHPPVVFLQMKTMNLIQMSGCPMFLRAYYSQSIPTCPSKVGQFFRWETLLNVNLPIFTHMLPVELVGSLAKYLGFKQMISEQHFCTILATNI